MYPPSRPPGRGRAAARRRLRYQRLARTIVVVVAIVVLLVVLFSGGGGHKGKKQQVTTSAPPASAGTQAPTTTATTATAPPPQHVQVAAAPASLPAARSRPSIVSDGSGLVILGGLIGGTPGTSTSSVLRFDPGTGTVTAAGSLSVATHDAAATPNAGKIFVFGGGEAVTIDAVQAYTPSGTSVVGHLPRPRSDVVATSIGGHAYILGGFDGSVGQSDVLRTDDGVSYSVVARLAVPVRYPGIVTIGSTIYLLGGVNAGRAVDDIQAIDVNTGTARIIGHLPTRVSDAMAFTLRGSVFLAGGLHAGTPTTDIERVDLTTGTTSSAGSLPAAVADAGVGELGDTAYLIGGEGPGRLSTIYAVTPG